MTPFQVRNNRINAMIRRMVAEGASDADIGRATKLTRHAVWARRKRIGVGNAVMDQAEARRQSVAKWHAAGLSDKEISLCLGTGISTAMTIRKKLGLAPNKPFLPRGLPPNPVRERKNAWARKAYKKKAKPKPVPAPEPPRPKIDLHAKVRPICAALGNVYDKAPKADVQQAIAAAMRAVHSDPAFARAWAEARNA